MANYILQNTADEIDTALSKVSSPTTSLTNTATSDPSLVTSGAVRAAIDNISVGNTLTVDSFLPAALETSGDTLTDTDDAIPTSAAVKGFVDAATSNDTPNNRLIIKVFPSDFHNAKSTNSYTPYIYDKKYIKTASSGGMQALACVDIPQGYKATHFTCTSYYISVTVYESSLTGGTAVQKGVLSSAQSATRTLNITDVVGSSSNFMSVWIYSSNASGNFSGGYFTIAKV